MLIGEKPRLQPMRSFNVRKIVSTPVYVVKSGKNKLSKQYSIGMNFQRSGKPGLSIVHEDALQVLFFLLFWSDESVLKEIFDIEFYFVLGFSNRICKLGSDQAHGLFQQPALSKREFFVFSNE